MLRMEISSIMCHHSLRERELAGDRIRVQASGAQHVPAVSGLSPRLSRLRARAESAAATRALASPSPPSLLSRACPVGGGPSRAPCVSTYYDDYYYIHTYVYVCMYV